MRRLLHLIALLLVCFGLHAGRVSALETGLGPVRVEQMAGGLKEPWGVAPLPEGGFLVTERGGRLLRVRQGRKRAIAGVPQVVARGQGGLLDITLAADFATSRLLFLTYSAPAPGGATTALARARLSEDETRLEDVRVLIEADAVTSAGRHFGSRVVEAADGTLFLTIGDRGARPEAQNRANHIGSILRLTRDGRVPADNPFVGQGGIRPEIWSYGHRNPQGAALDLRGGLVTAEHGARGGDEVNFVAAGGNYGWPVISYGRHYSGGKIGEGTAKPGMEQPQFYWDPSMAPSGLMVYSGALWPEWRGHIFVGSLKFNYIARLTGAPLREAGQIKGTETRRVRDIVEGPDGAIWFISVGNGAVYRLTPG